MAAQAKRFVGFDLETTELAPDRSSGALPPIACAALAPEGAPCEALFLPAAEPACYDAACALTREGAARVVRRLEELVDGGATLVTWNGAGFDLPVLARASGLHAECARLALGGVDMMFQVLAVKGWPIGLQVALQGMGLPGKTGDGAQAVDLWREGRHQEVLDYCAADAAGTLRLARAAVDAGGLRWRSTRGFAQSLALDGGWLTVEQCLALPEPDTSWMDRPLLRGDLVGWCAAAPAPAPASG